MSPVTSPISIIVLKIESINRITNNFFNSSRYERLAISSRFTDFSGSFSLFTRHNTPSQYKYKGPEKMFRTATLRAFSRVFLPRAQPPQFRTFTATSAVFKKAKGGKVDAKGAAETATLSTEDPTVVLKELENEYKETLKHFKEKVAITKQGNSNPKIFDDLKIPLSHGEEADFLSVAQTSLKGRNLIITVFDPKYAKHVISAILKAGMNLNPEHVPNMPQQLRVSLPPVTHETRLEIVKELKKNFEQFKNSHSFRHSLSSKRADSLKELKKYRKNDEIRKITADIEKLHKKYGNELQELFKVAEKQILS